MRRYHILPAWAYQAAGSSLAITTTSPLPSGTQGTAYSTTLAATGGTPPYTWTLVSGTLDTGLTLSSAGVISGTPANAEIDSVILRVTDSASAYVQSTFSLTINASGSYVFDYYIAPNGDDSNNGLTPATAWSITALNTKQSTYAGKKIGIIGDVGGVQTPIQYGTVSGTQTTLYSLYQALPQASQVLVVNGGTSGVAPTILASCTSAGVYSPRWAIIDASQPGTGNKPTVEASLMGQNHANSYGDVANWGNCTIDGLVVRYFTYSAIIFKGPTTTDWTGWLIKNCEVYGGNNVTSINNPGALHVEAAYQPTFLNNKIHDCYTTAGTANPDGHTGIFSFTSPGNVSLIAKYNTIYNCGAGIYMKDYWQYGEIAYNYIDVGIFSADDRIINHCVNMACPGSGQTLWVHHNVMIGSVYSWPASGSNWPEGITKVNNNTFYGWSGTTGNGLEALAFYAESVSVGTAQFYNNLVWSDYGYSGTGGNGSGTIYVVNDYGISPSTFNYNCYGSNAGGVRFGSYQAPPGTAAGSTFATWQGNTFDPNSITIASSPFNTTPTLYNTSTFAPNTSGASYTAGIGGTPTGACNASGGALDGTGRIGCNF